MSERRIEPLRLEDGRLLLPLVQELLLEMSKRPDHNSEELGGYRREAQRWMGRALDPATSDVMREKCRLKLIDLWLQVNDALS